MQAICQLQEPTPWVNALSVTQAPLESTEQALQAYSTCSFIGWREEQRKDPGIGPLFPFVINGVVPSRHQITPASWPFIKEFDKLSIKEGAMYRAIHMNDEKMHQIVLPACFRNEVLSQLHDHMGHMGRDKTLQLVWERFFWPKMAKDIEEYVRACRRCIQRKAPAKQAPLIPIVTTQPLEVVSMDHLTLEPSKGGFQHILVMTDLFTRYAVAVPVQNLSAVTTAKAFINHFVVHYGIPQRIHSDQGGAFESRVVKELCRTLDIKKSRTTSYHPEGNAVTERMNRSLLNMLGTLEPHAKLDWKSQVAPLVHAYNCATHAATGFSPYYLMFGRHPRLPIDLVMGTERSLSYESESVYVSDMQGRLAHAYDIARKLSGLSKGRHKQLKDRKCCAAILAIGDRVLVRKLHFTGKHKLEDRWENEVYVVVDQPNESIPVFTVQPEAKAKGDRRRCMQRTLHRNHLLPVGNLLNSDALPTLGLKPRSEKRQVAEEQSDEEVSDSDDSVEIPDVMVSSRSNDAAAGETQDDPVVQTGHTSADVAATPIQVDAQSTSESSVSGEDHEGNDSSAGRDAAPQQGASVVPNAEESDPDEDDVTDSHRGRYSLRTHRKPPDRWGYVQSMNTSQKLDIAQQLMQFLNKD